MEYDDGADDGGDDPELIPEGGGDAPAAPSRAMPSAAPPDDFWKRMGMTLDCKIGNVTREFGQPREQVVHEVAGRARGSPDGHGEDERPHRRDQGWVAALGDEGGGWRRPQDMTQTSVRSAWRPTHTVPGFSPNTPRDELERKAKRSSASWGPWPRQTGAGEIQPARCGFERNNLVGSIGGSEFRHELGLVAEAHGLEHLRGGDHRQRGRGQRVLWDKHEHGAMTRHPPNVARARLASTTPTHVDFMMGGNCKDKPVFYPNHFPQVEIENTPEYDNMNVPYYHSGNGDGTPALRLQPDRYSMLTRAPSTSLPHQTTFSTWKGTLSRSSAATLSI